MPEKITKRCDTETLILQAAETEFLDKGFSAAKTTEIAKAAGVTHAMLHYYFRTKENLFDMIVNDKLNQLSDILLNVIGNPDLPLKERISCGIERHFDFLMANPKLPRFIINELAVNPQRIDIIRDKLLEKAGKVLDNLQAELDNRPGAKINGIMLLADIVSLNVFPFVAAPIMMSVAGNRFNDLKQLLEMRKKENVKTVLTKLNLL